MTIPEFTHRHKDLLIIIADPKTDEIYCSYGDKNVRGQIGEKGNIKVGVVRDILKKGRFQTKIDAFMIELAGALKGFTGRAKFFYSGVRDALWAVASSAKKN